MNILLVGEYSGFFTNLRSGLEKKGHTVTLLSDGDGFKKIGGSNGNISLPNGKNIISKIYGLCIYPFFNRFLKKKYDATIIINFDVFHPRIIKKMMKKLRKKTPALLLTSCGYDYALLEAFNNKQFEYYMFDENVDKVERFNSKSWKVFLKDDGEKKVIDKYIDLVIPTAYEYGVGYSDKKSDIILLPVDLEKITYQENIVKDKIVFFHGLNRETEKGTKYIVEALKKLEENYPDDVEVIVDGKMPYDKYLEVMSKTNVVVDQCKSYWYGMNAIIAMAQGKVVLSGARKESLAAIGLTNKDCPIVPIGPNVEEIYKQLEMVVKNKNSIATMGKNSRAYVERYHDNLKIAQKYVDEIEKILKEKKLWKVLF